MKSVLLYFVLVSLIGFTNFIFAQIVYIPNANFKASLVGNSSINTNGDNEIQLSEAVAYTDTINVSNKQISNLTGIEEFTSITGLVCYSNPITNLNISANTALITLNCHHNLLTSLDVSANSSLLYLYCNNNLLSNLNLTGATALIYLNCNNNHLASLNVSMNSSLTTLFCDGNQLTSLNITTNSALTNLHCSDNHLSNLNILANSALTRLECSSNQLSSLDVSLNFALIYLNCHDNQLINLDLSVNTSFYILYCYNNLLTSLNLQNGNNTYMSGVYYNSFNNPDLTCIQVDDVSWSTEHWQNKDSIANFSLDCAVNIDKMTPQNSQILLFPNPSNDKIEINGFQNGTAVIIDVRGNIVYTMNIKNTNSSIDIENLLDGIYIVKIKSNDRNIIKKLLKQ